MYGWKQVEVVEFLGSVGRLAVSWLAFTKAQRLRFPHLRLRGTGVWTGTTVPGLTAAPTFC